MCVGGCRRCARNLLTILTPPENADVHVSFQGAELRGDYFCVTQIAFFVNCPRKGGSATVIKPRRPHGAPALAVVRLRDQPRMVQGRRGRVGCRYEGGILFPRACRQAAALRPPPILPPPPVRREQPVGVRGGTADVDEHRPGAGHRPIDRHVAQDLGSSCKLLQDNDQLVCQLLTQHGAKD
eukprot:3201917-Prymnesium_polylepis.1